MQGTNTNQSNAILETGSFKTFLLRGNVVELAVGVVIGAAFNSVVNGIVKDFITPLVAKITDALTGATIDPAKFMQSDWNGFYIGDFISVVISFFITAFVVYFFVVKPVAALQKHFFRQKKAEEPETRDCPFCFNAVSVKATRCGFCTSQLPSIEQPFQTMPSRQDISQPMGAQQPVLAQAVGSPRMGTQQGFPPQTALTENGENSTYRFGSSPERYHSY